MLCPYCLSPGRLDRAAMYEIVHLLKEFFIPYGIWGLLILSFLDSSFVPMPQIIDMVVIALSLSNPHLMIFYALAAVVGSSLGITIVYSLGKKSGEVLLSKKLSKARMERVQNVLLKYDILVIMIAGVIPPPFPYKVFIFSVGALQFVFPKFILAVILSRSIRFYFEGVMAVLYGDFIIAFIRERSQLAALIFLVLVLAGFFIYKAVVDRLNKEELS